MGFICQGLYCMDLAHIITFLYIVFNSGRIFSYIPQIISVYKEKSAVTAISLLTWSFWAGANFTTGLYTIMVHYDLLMTIISMSNALCCMIVIGQVISKRYEYGYWQKKQIFNQHATITLSPEESSVEAPLNEAVPEVSTPAEKLMEQIQEETEVLAPVDNLEQDLMSQHQTVISVESTDIINTSNDGTTYIQEELTVKKTKKRGKKAVKINE